MNAKIILSLLLATMLQARLLAAASLPDRVERAPAWAFVHRLLPARADALGGYDVVSTATTNVNGPFTINGTVGKAQPTTRLTTTGHVAESWSANPNPVAPGLNLISSGFITGTPTQSGVFTSVITAWEFVLSGPSASATFTITITGGGTAPSITTEPVSQILPAGTNATLTVAAGGSPPPAYHWSFGGASIAGATNATLVLTDIQPAQSGVYTVTVTNASGSVSTNATLTVEVSPAITNQPQSQIVTAGAAVSFTAGGRGTSLNWQWWFNSNLVAGGTNPVLTLPAATANQSGFYAVVASNGVGVATSGQARLLAVPPAGVAEAPVLQLAAGEPGLATLGFATLPGYNYEVLFSDSLPAPAWASLTNVPAAFAGSSVSLPQSTAGAVQRFYRVGVSGN